MADRISGLYKSLEHILGKFCIQEKLKEEVRVLKEEFEKSSLNKDQIQKEYILAVQERDFLRNDYVELHDIKSELTKQKERILKVFKEKFTGLQNELSEAIETRNSYKIKFEELEKKYIDMSEEFKKFRVKMKLKHRNSEGKTEKFCKNCQKSYNDHENFHWSCRTHASKLSGDMYWCCGKTGKDAIGCKISKHISKEDEDLEDNEEDLISSIKFCSVMNKQACKVNGHTITNCQKDPNYKTGADVSEEKERLVNIRKRKKKSTQFSDNLSKIGAMLSNKSVLLHESFLNFNEDEELFEDLDLIKEEVDFDEEKNNNRVVIEQKANKKEETKKSARLQRNSLSIIPKIEISEM